MPYRFEFDAGHKLLLIVLEGEIPVHEVETFNDTIRSRVTDLEPVGAIADFSAVTAFLASGDVMRKAAMRPSPFPVETPRFIVAPTDYLFGMARMYELAANRPKEKLRVVRTMNEALAALGIQNPQFEPIP